MTEHVSVDAGGLEGRRDSTGARKTSGSDGYVHYLDCRDGFMGGYVETYETTF